MVETNLLPETFWKELRLDDPDVWNTSDVADDRRAAAGPGDPVGHEGLRDIRLATAGSDGAEC